MKKIVVVLSVVLLVAACWSGNKPDTFTAQEWADFVDWCQDNSVVPYTNPNQPCGSWGDVIMEKVDEGYEEDCVILEVQRFVSGIEGLSLKLGSCQP